MRRGQLPMAAVEAALAVVLVLSVAAGFALGVPDANTREPQLEAYASDVLTILADESPGHANETRLAEVMVNPDGFDRERDAFERRIERILPDNVMFRAETPHGAVGYPKPDRVTTGVATTATPDGDVTLRVWYA